MTTVPQIPQESLETDEAARAVIKTMLRNAANAAVCEEVLKKAAMKENPYAAKAYRRAAILLARAEFLLIDKDTRYLKLINELGMPVNGSTTWYAYDLITSRAFIGYLEKNPLLAYPLEWRNGNLKECDDRIMLALRIVKFLIRRNNGSIGCASASLMSDALFGECRERKQEYAYYYYTQRRKDELIAIHDSMMRQLAHIA